MTGLGLRQELFILPVKAFVEYDKRTNYQLEEEWESSNWDEVFENAYETLIEYVFHVQEGFDSDFDAELFDKWRNEVDHVMYTESKRCYLCLFNENNFEATSIHLALAAIFIARWLSLHQSKKVFRKLACNNLHNFQKAFTICAFLLNEQNLKYLKAFSDNVDEPFIDARREIFAEVLKNSLQENSTNPKVLSNIFKGICHFGDSTLFAFFKKKYSTICKPTKSARQNHFKELPKNIDAEGRVLQRVGDPPGQKCVYIPPGDTAKEAYRLSTFLRFPSEIPVTPPDLAAAGFYYTGYKDRVKCFTCATSVESWILGDKPIDVRWHKSNCSMVRGDECGNIRLGSDGVFARMFDRPARADKASAQIASPVSPLQAPTKWSNSSSSSSPGGQNRLPTVQSSSYNTSTSYQAPVLATIPSVHHEQLVRSLDLRRESERLKSFGSWPSTLNTVSLQSLARSGFFYLGNSDRVQCFSCGGVLRNWNYGDNVTGEHRTHFPNCRMALGVETHNIPLTPGQQPAPYSQPTFARPNNRSDLSQVQLRNSFPCLYPVNPHMRSDKTRLETFDRRWPAARVRASPQQIAHAGFYFLGDRDRVKCWYCNGGLQNWEPNDEPWTEHAKWFPTCEFLLQNRGPEFVHEIVRKFPNLQRPVLRNGFDVPPSERSETSSAPVVVIDPQEEIKRNKERVAKEMSSSIAKMAEEMGFSRSAIHKTIERKLNKDNTMYKNFSEMFEDLVNVSDDSDEGAAEETMDIETQLKKEQTPTPQDTSGASASMEERMKELEDMRQCKICLDALADVVFVPCGHLCSCVRCAQSLRKCPICRVKIEKAIKTYLS